MTKEQVVAIPIAEIAIPNPRSRNKITFDAIVASIQTVGLKKPITVCPRASVVDGFRYDLICGQGRLEAFLALGETAIPALIETNTKEDCFLKSLVENIARRPPSNMDLLREVQNLKKRGYKTEEVARKLGMHRAYISDLVHLLQHGELALLQAVEAQRIPISVAVTIASGNDLDMQRALSDAYEKGELRGSKLESAKRMIARRSANRTSCTEDAPASKQLTSNELVREYERQTNRQRALVGRAASASRRMLLLVSAMKRLVADENFVTLLRAEHLSTMPKHLAARLK
jgi:ParB family chromosome partitioning protein